MLIVIVSLFYLFIKDRYTFLCFYFPNSCNKINTLLYPYPYFHSNYCKQSNILYLTSAYLA